MFRIPVLALRCDHPALGHVLRGFKINSAKIASMPMVNRLSSSSSGSSSSPNPNSKPSDSQSKIPTTPEIRNPPNPPKTNSEKIKAAVRDYGSTVLVFHITSGVMFLGMWYLIVSSGVDVSSVITTLGLEGTVGKLAGGAGTFVVAYAIHKATAPLRIGLTLTVSPLIVGYLRRKGLMKIKR